jgi:hypothetical protein
MCIIYLYKSRATLMDRGTGFQAVEFVVSQRRSDVLEQILRILETKYMSLDVLTLNAGSVFLYQIWNER